VGKPHGVRGKCACGCGKKRGLHRHHVVYQQQIRKETGTDIARGMRLTADPRNIVMLGYACHAAHHSRQRVLGLHRLPDSVFEFASELMGHGPAYEYLRRTYGGEDPRLDALLEDAA
jgi:hypothetical protein